MIPKIIHCAYIGNKVPNNKKYINSWFSVLLDYKFILYYDSRCTSNAVINSFDKRFELIDVSLFPKMLNCNYYSQAIKDNDYVFAVDALKFTMPQVFGGIYLDYTDVEVLKNFDNCLDCNLMLAYESEKYKTIQSGIFGVSKGNNLFNEIADFYSVLNYDKNARITAPEMIKFILGNKLNSVNILPESYFTNYDWFIQKPIYHKDAITVHHYSGTWNSLGDHIFRYIVALVNRHKLYKYFRYPLSILHKIMSLFFKMN